MMWDLPIAVTIDGTEYAIRNKCDYRVVLDVIAALNDDELDMENRMQCALFAFYGNKTDLNTWQKVLIKLGANVETAIKEMMKIINNGEEATEENQSKPKLMDWEKDFKLLAPPISRILGYDVRTPDKYTHFFTFLGAYMEIGDCTFANIVSIRSKKQKGKKLEKWEEEFYRENYKLIDMGSHLTKEEEDWLLSITG